MISISMMKIYNIFLLCGFTFPFLIWYIRYIPIYKSFEKEKFMMYFYTSLLSISLSLNQFFLNIFDIDIRVFLLLQILLLPFLRYYNKDLYNVYKNKQISNKKKFLKHPKDRS